jgi:hypothetical protein
MYGKDTLERREAIESAEHSFQQGAPPSVQAVMQVINHYSSCTNENPLRVAGRPIMRSPGLLRDLEVHRTYDGGMGTPLLTVLGKTRLAGGSAYLSALLGSPTDELDVLMARQQLLRDTALRLEDEMGARVDELLRDLAETEGSVVWMFECRKDAAMRALYDMAFFRMWPFRCLNRFPVMLTAANLHRIIVTPAIGLLSPVAYFLVPFLVMRFRFGVKIPFGTYMRVLLKSMAAASSLIAGPMAYVKHVSCAFSMLFYFQSLFTSFEVSSTLNLVCRSLRQRMEACSKFFAASAALSSVVWTPAVASACFPCTQQDHELAPHGHSCCEQPSEKPAGFWSRVNFGAQLCEFREFDETVARATLRCTYALDAVVAMVRAKTSLQASSWTAFVKGPRPVLEVQGMVHPVVAGAVPNTWRLGALAGGDPGENAARHALVTGPNAGGKSTLLKALLISALMSQTLTFANAAACSMTPFRYISSHINVPDSQGRESLFEAEMHRAKRNVEALHELGGEDTALVVMDEIFSSTNPVEGIAGAFAVAKHLARSPRAIAVVSTHYLYLCRLAKLPGTGYGNFRIPVEIDAQTGAVLRHPYRLLPGISRQYVALELLRESGFPAEILDDAIEVKKTLLLPIPARQVPSRRADTKT